MHIRIIAPENLTPKSRMISTMRKFGYATAAVEADQYLEVSDQFDRFVFITPNTEDEGYIVSEFFKVGDWRAKPVAETFTIEEAKARFDRAVENAEEETADQMMETTFEFASKLANLFAEMGEKCNVIEWLETSLELAIDNYQDSLVDDSVAE